MPNRILRDWTDSFAVHELSANEERFFVRLLMKADDFGRFHGSPKLLKAALFPLHSLDDGALVKWRDRCATAGLIDVYEDDRGRVFLEIKNFNQRTRATTSKYPARSHDRQMTVTRPSHDRLDGDGDGDGDGGECGDGARQVASHSLAEIPTIDEVKAFAVTIGLIEWKAVDWFQKQEALGWMMGNQRIRKWQPLLTRLRTFWEADGKPLKPPGKASPAPANGAAMPSWARIKTIEERIKVHPGNSESVFCSGMTKDKADFKEMRRKLRELKADQEAEAVA
jgi:hypothetical protein